MDDEKEIEVDDLIDNDGIDDVDIELKDVGTVLNVEDYKEKDEDDSAEVVVKKDEDEEEEVLEEEEPLSDEDREKLGKRAQRRISQLIKRSKTAEENYIELEKRYEESRNKTAEFAASTQTRERELLVEHEERIKAQEREVLITLKASKEVGDIDQEIEAQDSLMQLKAEKMLVERAKAHFAKQDRDLEQVRPADEGGREVPQPEARRGRPVAVDKNALKWQKNNDWFGGETRKEQLMTNMAYTVHNDLLSEGFMPDPEDSDSVSDYYSELNSRIQAEFPEEFEGSEQAEGGGTVSVTPRKKPVQVVTGGTRTSGKTSSSKVLLTRSELMRAKSLGVTPKAYAREKAKIASRS